MFFLILTSLWVRLVSAKYKFQSFWISYTNPSRCSPIWMAITKMGHCIRYQFIWSIGNGKSIHVFYDPWIQPVPFCAWPTFINIEVEWESMRLDQFFSNAFGWNYDLLTNLVSLEIIIMIKSILIAYGQGTDKLDWHVFRSLHVFLQCQYSSPHHFLKW